MIKTKQELLNHFSDINEMYNNSFMYQTLSNMIDELLEQQTCKDCVSRQAVEEITWEEPSYTDALNVLTEVRDKIRQLPSVTPQRKRGKWIEVEVCNCYATLKCSVCDRVIEPTFTYGEYSYDDIKEWYPYCHCGCRMNGGGEE